MNPIIIDDRLTEEQVQAINRDRDDRLLRRMRETPEEGRYVEYLGRSFFVLPTVFWPHYDSIPLVRNFEVNEGEQVLDLCTGSGNVALHAGRRSRERIVAVDINPNAVESARRNLGLLKLDPYRCSYNVRCGDLFDAVSDDERFHVIMANVPFNIRRIVDNADRAFGDPDLSLHRRLFTGAQKHLRQGGRMYLANANFGTVDEMYALAGEHGFSMELIGRMRDPLMNFKVYYAFELKRE